VLRRRWRRRRGAGYRVLLHDTVTRNREELPVEGARLAAGLDCGAWFVTIDALGFASGKATVHGGQR